LRRLSASINAAMASLVRASWQFQRNLDVAAAYGGAGWQFQGLSASDDRCVRRAVQRL
jgi:hypothetical protein